MIRLLRYCIFLVILSACTHHLHVSEVKTSHYELKTSKNDSITDLSVLPYKEKLDKEMNQVVAYSDSALTRDGFESSLGNFVLMAAEDYINSSRKTYTGNSVIILNRGGLRNNLPKGEITKGNIFELMPFDNEIAILKISGEKFKECITAMIKEKKLISRNLVLLVKNTEPEEITIFKKPLNINEDYFIITTDYLAMGGDNCNFFGKPISYENTGIKLRDAIISYCESLTKNNTHLKPLRFEQIKFSK